MTLPRIVVRLFLRWLRPALAAVLLLNGGLGASAVAGPHAMAPRPSDAASADSVLQHCPAHEQSRSGTHPSAPATHPCCDESGCGCGVAPACHAVVAVPLGTHFAPAPMIAAPSPSAVPPGARSPVFRPPIA